MTCIITTSILISFKNYTKLKKQELNKQELNKQELNKKEII